MTAHLRRAADLDWTLGELVERRAAEHGDRVLLRFGDGQTLSFGGLAARVAAVRTLLAARGLGPGDRVALMMRNSLRYPVAWLGVTSAGMAAVPVNSRSGPLDSRHLIDHSGARLVIADDTTAATVHAVIAGIDRRVAVEDASRPDWLPAGLGRGAPPADVPAGALAGVQYTSGTTGLPKGCMLSHRFWQQIGQSSADVLRLDESSVLLSAQPFSYIDPLWNVVAALRAAAELVILDGFSHPAVLECAVVAVPDDDLGEELRAVVVPVAGAAPSPRELREHVAQRLARFKIPRYWEFRSELPHTPSERVAKHRIGGPEADLIDLAGG